MEDNIPSTIYKFTPGGVRTLDYVGDSPHEVKVSLFVDRNSHETVRVNRREANAALYFESEEQALHRAKQYHEDKAKEYKQKIDNNYGKFC